MRWLFVVLALLSALPARADSRVRSRLSTHRQPTGDVAAVYRFVGTADGTWDPSFSRHARPTVTGPATTVDRGDGTAVTVPTNTLAVGPDGALVYGARTQSVLHTNDPTQAEWIKETGVSVEKNSASCPIGPTGDRMHLVTAAADAGIYQSWTHGATAYTVSAWLARATADADCTASLGFSAQAGLGYTQPTLTDTPTRISKTATGAATASGIHMLARTGDTCARFCFWGANETNTSALFPYSATESAPLSVAATAVAVPNALTGNEWCVAGRFQAADWRRFSGAYGSLAATSTAYARPNAIYLYVVGSTGRPSLSVFDSSGTEKAVIGPALSGDTEVAVVGCSNASGAMVLRVDGTDYTTTTGEGTGVVSAQEPNVNIGGGAPGVFSGSIRELVLCNSSDPARCR